jgi:hypothetical protein
MPSKADIAAVLEHVAPLTAANPTGEIGADIPEDLADIPEALYDLLLTTPGTSRRPGTGPSPVSAVRNAAGPTVRALPWLPSPLSAVTRPVLRAA